MARINLSASLVPIFVLGLSVAAKAETGATQTPANENLNTQTQSSAQNASTNASTGGTASVGPHADSEPNSTIEIGIEPRLAKAYISSSQRQGNADWSFMELTSIDLGYRFRRQFYAGGYFMFSALTSDGHPTTGSAGARIALHTSRILVSSRAGFDSWQYHDSSGNTPLSRSVTGYLVGLDVGWRPPLFGDTGSVPLLDIIAGSTLSIAEIEHDAAGSRGTSGHMFTLGAGLRLGFDYVFVPQ